MIAVAQRTALDAAEEVAAAIGDGPVGVYVLGSVSLGAFEPGSSDLDMVAVFERLSTEEVDGLAARVLEVDVSPARQLELVVYAAGSIALNLNTEPLRVEHEPAADEWFWFVLDRAIGSRSAVALSGPPFAEALPPPERGEVLAALAESLRWHDRAEPSSRNALLNALRTLHWLETDDWIGKPEAARRLLERVRESVEAAR